jgi:KUP system potassium uptake protein
LDESSSPSQQTLFALSLASIGVVFGDIGTSPLYALRESIGSLLINASSILGILSLIFWALILVISIKYLLILFHADNKGEGGILALLALLKRAGSARPQLFFMIGVFGAGLMLGDGMLTPAISVISAIEGVHVFFPQLSEWIIPLTCVILVLLFSVQSYGTEKIGFIFGPVIVLWFIVIAVLGGVQIVKNPSVLLAVNPLYGIRFLYANGWHGYALLGGVFLVATGGEALYADLGHFGKLPIRLGWFLLALPSLLLNYFGQGAYLLQHPEAIVNPFYMLAPKWFSLPLMIIAAMATIIASQAVISATFSLTKQAVLLGLYPHLPIVQTSQVKMGQIYIPQMNLILGIGTIMLILSFRNTNALTHAYGIAVNLVMVLTTLLTVFLAIYKWRWRPIYIIGLFSFFGVIELAFLGANVQKLLTGGWVPVLFAMVCAIIMHTWYKGRTYVRQKYYLKKNQLSKILRQFDYKSLYHIPGITAIFITDIYDPSGGSFLHFLKLNRMLPEHILIVNYMVETVPHVFDSDRFRVNCLSERIVELTLHYGFMDTVSIPQALALANKHGILPFLVDTDNTTYMLEIPNVVATRNLKSLRFFWQERLFAFLVRNYSANLDIEFYHLPYNRTIAMGTYYMI